MTNYVELKIFKSSCLNRFFLYSNCTCITLILYYKIIKKIVLNDEKLILIQIYMQ